MEGFVKWAERSPGLAQKVDSCTVEYGEVEDLFKEFDITGSNMTT